MTALQNVRFRMDGFLGCSVYVVVVVVVVVVVLTFKTIPSLYPVN